MLCAGKKDRMKERKVWKHNNKYICGSQTLHRWIQWLRNSMQSLCVFVCKWRARALFWLSASASASAFFTLYLPFSRFLSLSLPLTYSVSIQCLVFTNCQHTNTPTPSSFTAAPMSYLNKFKNIFEASERNERKSTSRYEKSEYRSITLQWLANTHLHYYSMV